MSETFTNAPAPPEGAADPVEALIRQGEHPAAAQLAVARGELRLAVGIYQRLWRYRDALPLALELGDTALAIELALDANLPAQARRLAEDIPPDDAAALVRAAGLFSRRGAHQEAGLLAERAKD